MKIQTITKTALGAAALGFIFSMIQLVTMAIQLADDGYLWTRIVLFFFTGMKWVYIGLIILFIIIIFRPQSLVKGAWALGISSVIQLFLSAWTVYLYFAAATGERMLGNDIYYVLLELVVPLTLLVFSLLLASAPRGLALRITALLTGLALLVSILHQAFFYGLFDVYSIFDIVSTAFIAQWFWVLFLERKSVKI